MPAALMAHDIDPAEAIWKAIGSAEDDIEIFNHQVLVAVYIRPDKTKSGIYLTGQTRDEDRFQGKVGMILIKGERAFESEGKWWNPPPAEMFNEGDWVFFRPSDGWAITINGVLCRILHDTSVMGRTKRPDLVF